MRGAATTFVALVAAALVVAPTTIANGARHNASVHVPRSPAAPTSPCAHTSSSRLTYHYPVRPFRRQHAIRGFFGDPRTVTSDPFGEDRPETPGSFTFHNGVDIVAGTGTRVYPVVSGTVEDERYGDEVKVATDDGRVFQYFHIAPIVRVGQHVVAYTTILGRVRPEWHHVHLTEIDGFRAHNPLDPGHLEPYRDQTTPSVDALIFRNRDGRDVDPTRLRGQVEIAADAEDMPPLAVPGEWFGFPVTPALVRWRLVAAAGRQIVPETTVADFRRNEPPNREFWRVYTAGTYQNFPVFAHHYFWRLPGRYLFELTPSPLDTTRLQNGRYDLTVDVADVCGNRGSLSTWITIDNAS